MGNAILSFSFAHVSEVRHIYINISCIFLVKIQFLKITLYVNELLLIEIKDCHSCM